MPVNKYAKCTVELVLSKPVLGCPPLLSSHLPKSGKSFDDDDDETFI